MPAAPAYRPGAMNQWCIEREIPLLAKSTHRARIEENNRGA
jgi:hypothetical protein